MHRARFRSTSAMCADPGGVSTGQWWHAHWSERGRLLKLAWPGIEESGIIDTCSMIAMASGPYREVAIRLPGSAKVSESRRRRALALVQQALSLSAAARRLGCAPS